MTDKLRTYALAGALLAGLVGVAALAPAASATEEQEPVTTCATFQMRGATGEYPAVVFGDAPAGTSVTKDTAVLKKPTGVQPGVEFAAFDLDIEATGDITVEYALADGATPDAGAVRLFFYDEQDANTLTAAPDGQAVATSNSGTLTIAVDGPIGTLGMVYDASNATTGTVTFSNLKIDGQPVSFLPEVCATPSPSASASATAGPSPSPSAGVSRSPVGALPVTGTSNLGLLVGVGLSLVAAGLAAVYLLRVRRRYEA
jgi:LPXTG-motif cell wall-anchored protein